MTGLNVGSAELSAQGTTDQQREASLSDRVKTAVETYFSDLNGHPPGNLYHLVMSEVERPLLATVMHEARGNQTRAAKMLGISRSTLRKRLAQYGLSD